MRKLAPSAALLALAAVCSACDGSPTLLEGELLAAQFAAPVAAQHGGPPIGICPPGFDLIFGNGADRNRDGRVCQKVVKGTTVIIDNVRRGLHKKG